jgi:hypothetical protein
VDSTVRKLLLILFITSSLYGQNILERKKLIATEHVKSDTLWARAGTDSTIYGSPFWYAESSAYAVNSYSSVNALTADSSGKTDNSVYARKGVDNEFDTTQTINGDLFSTNLNIYSSINWWEPEGENWVPILYPSGGFIRSDIPYYNTTFIQATSYYGDGSGLTGIAADSLNTAYIKHPMQFQTTNGSSSAFSITNDPKYFGDFTAHALLNIHRGGLSSYGTNDDLFGLIVYNRPTNTDSTKATIGGAWIGTSDSINNYSSKSWQTLRVQHDHYSSRVNMPTNVITSKFSFYNGAGKARNLKLFTAEIENQKSADAEADTAIAYHVHKNFGDTLSSTYKFAFQNESNAPMVTAGRITSDSGMYALSFNGSGSDLTGVLKPTDSSAIRNYSNALYGGLGSSNTWSGDNKFRNSANDVAYDSLYGASIVNSGVVKTDSLGARAVNTSGNLTSAGWLKITGNTSFVSADGFKLYKTSANGGVIQGVTGSVTDFVVITPTGTELMANVAGTNNWTFGRTGAVKCAIGSSTPFSMMDIKTTNSIREGLNITHGVTNTTVTSLAQSIDTSSFNVAFTGTGKPVVTLTGATANSIMKIDSVGNLGIGTATPAGALDVTSTTGAFIVPRMTTTQRDALSAVNGMIIFNTTTSKFNFYEGAWVTKVND